MADLNDLRDIILKLPETCKGTHFRLPTYKVLDKSFVGLDKDQIHIMISLDKTNIHHFITDNPEVFKEVWQSGKYLVGIRFSIDHVSIDQLQNLIELAWRNKAPKKLVKKFETRIT
jgi:hypothetical protein